MDFLCSNVVILLSYTAILNDIKRAPCRGPLWGPQGALFTALPWAPFIRTLQGSLINRPIPRAVSLRVV